MTPAQEKIIDMWGKIHDTIFTSLSGSLSEDELKSVLYKPLKQLGKESAKGTEGDARTAGELIMQVEKHWDIRGRVIENSRSKFVREVSYCPWSYFKPISCRVLAWYMEGFCEGVGPNCQYKLEKLIPAGADVCRWSVTVKDKSSVKETLE